MRSQRLQVVCVWAVLWCISDVLFADQAPSSSGFEVASVKPNRGEAPATTLFPLGPGDAYAATGGFFRATNQPLITFLRFAYRLGQGDLLDLPRWVYDDRFDVQARTIGELTKDQMRLMMRALLIDRFRLVTHTKIQTQPIFDLTLAKRGRLGPRLRAHLTDDACETDSAPPLAKAPSPSARYARPSSTFQLPTLPCGSIGFVNVGIGDRGRIVGNGEPMGRIADVLKSPFTGIDRPVRDRTGLTGTFDFFLEWSLVADSPPVAERPTGRCGTTLSGSTVDAIRTQADIDKRAGRCSDDRSHRASNRKLEMACYRTGFISALPHLDKSLMRASGSWVVLAAETERGSVSSNRCLGRADQQGVLEDSCTESA